MEPYGKLESEEGEEAERVQGQADRETQGTPNRRIAETAGISVRRVQKLWGRHRDKDRISYPLPMSRPGGAPRPQGALPPSRP